jgi:hypothetical protein
METMKEGKEKERREGRIIKRFTNILGTDLLS